LLVKVKVTVPADCGIANPLLLIVATELLLLLHVPPVLGESWTLLPIQVDVCGKFIDGLAKIVIVEVGFDLHPVLEFVNSNVTFPCDTPVTRPEFDIVAIDEFELCQFPPLLGLSCNVDPTHNSLDGIDTEGFSFTVTEALGSDVQLVRLEVNINVVLPAETPVAFPELSIVAILGFEEDHVPPEEGVRLILDPMHKLVEGNVILGLGFTVKFEVELVHPFDV
jgi:hypothetical protein